jgi:hypothetical protein
VLSAKLRSTEPGRRGSEAVALRHPVMPVANSLGSGHVGCEARKIPAVAGVFFLDFPFYRSGT